MGVDVCQKDGRFMSCKKMLSSCDEIVDVRTDLTVDVRTLSVIRS